MEVCYTKVKKICMRACEQGGHGGRRKGGNVPVEEELRSSRETGKSTPEGPTPPPPPQPETTKAGDAELPMEVTESVAAA